MPLSGLEAYIMNVYTIPMWRGQGIATALLKEIICFVREIEAKRLWLHFTEVRAAWFCFDFKRNGNGLVMI
ncbi:GNAT family N-acetyltransferase [Nostoc punctiforme UO1]|uniref:GNAT family N-acetyltransferase n=1 Tax=Nostoc punctiforme TaxID=272131 RepID=UPI0030A5A239